MNRGRGLYMQETPSNDGHYCDTRAPQNGDQDGFFYRELDVWTIVQGSTPWWRKREKVSALPVYLARHG